MDHTLYIAATINCGDKLFPVKRGGGKPAYLASNSIRDCRMKATEPLRHRVPARVGITGGIVEDSLSSHSSNHSTSRNLRINAKTSAQTARDRSNRWAHRNAAKFRLNERPW